MVLVCGPSLALLPPRPLGHFFPFNNSRCTPNAPSPTSTRLKRIKPGEFVPPPATKMAKDDASDLSSLSSLSPPPPSESESEESGETKGILKFFSKVPKEDMAPKEPSPPQRKREPSPPHEYVFADSPDIAVSPPSLFAPYGLARTRAASRSRRHTHCANPPTPSSSLCSGTDSTTHSQGHPRLLALKSSNTISPSRCQAAAPRVSSAAP